MTQEEPKGKEARAWWWGESRGGRSKVVVRSLDLFLSVMGAMGYGRWLKGCLEKDRLWSKNRKLEGGGCCHYPGRTQKQLRHQGWPWG